MRDRIGEEFDGTISGVVPFGVFVALDSVYVEGLVHVSELGEDYFQFDSTKHQMLGERSGQRFRLGDRLRVKLVKADLETGRIDFVMGSPPAATPFAEALTAPQSSTGRERKMSTPRGHASTGAKTAKPRVAPTPAKQASKQGAKSARKKVR
jgi:ribonuclease R